MFGLGVKFWVGGKIRGDILGGGEIFGWGGKILSQVEILGEGWNFEMVQNLRLGTKY